jgi:hypothetical protein
MPGSDLAQMKDWIRVEHQRRLAEGRAVRGVAVEARELGLWVRRVHPGLPRYLSNSTIEASIRHAHRRARLSAPRRSLDGQ